MICHLNFPASPSFAAAATAACVWQVLRSKLSKQTLDFLSKIFFFAKLFIFSRKWHHAHRLRRGRVQVEPSHRTVLLQLPVEEAELEQGLEISMPETRPDQRSACKSLRATLPTRGFQTRSAKWSTWTLLFKIRIPEIGWPIVTGQRGIRRRHKS